MSAETSPDETTDEALETEVADEASETEELDTPEVEEFYNPYHDKKDGRFTFGKGGSRGKIVVPMSKAAAASNAVVRAYNAARKSKAYKTAQERTRGTWADREKGQGGLRHAKGTNSKKADAARAANAKGKNPANKDGSAKLVGGFKLTGDKDKDFLQIMRLDRGSKARESAAAKYEAKYGASVTSPAAKKSAAKAAKRIPPHLVTGDRI